jgi:hypothetical protein
MRPHQDRVASLKKRILAVDGMAAVGPLAEKHYVNRKDIK